MHPRLADLADARVAIWGFGREGRAALAALRRYFPSKPLTLFCSEDEAVSIGEGTLPLPPAPSLTMEEEMQGAEEPSDQPTQPQLRPHAVASFDRPGKESVNTLTVVTTAPDVEA